MTDPLPNPPPQPPRPDVSFGIPARAPTPRKKPSRTKVVLIVLACGVATLVLGVGGLGAIAYYFAHHQGSETVKPGDRDYVVTFDDLAKHASGLKKVASGEHLFRVDMLGVHKLSYQYQVQNELFMTSEVTVGRSSTSALTDYSAVQLGFKASLAAFGKDIELVDDDQLLEWGDQSHAMLMKKAGKPLGNVFVARKGNRTFFLAIFGIYFRDPAAFEQLVKPKLDKLESFQP